MLVIGDSVFLSVTFAIMAYIAWAMAQNRTVTVSVTLVATFMYVFAMWIPAHLQLAGTLESKIVRAGVALPIQATELSHLAVRWAIELAVVALAEWTVWRSAKARQISPVASVVDRGGFEKRVALVLITIGAISTVVFPAPALENRADAGQGFETLMRTFLVVGLAYLAYYRCFNRPYLWVVFVFGIALLVANNVRSPLLMVVCGLLAGEIATGRIRRLRRLVAIALIVLVFVIAGAYMSNARANATRHLGLTQGEVFSDTLANPWISAYEAGIDTLDGYRFSIRVAEVEHPRPSDLANVFLTFVPRDVWPEKPTALGPDLSAKYLGYKAAGQFLSPVGYLTLTLGSYPAAVLGLGIFALLAALAVRYGFRSFAYAIVLMIVLRFMLSGSSFDIYYGLTYLLTYLVGYSVVRTGDALRKVDRDRFKPVVILQAQLSRAG